MLQLALLLAPALPLSDVHVVVDDPGSDDELQIAADAASPGDVLLVQSGIYTTLTLDGKPLHVVADVGADVRTSSIVFRNLPAGTTTSLVGLEIGTGLFLPAGFDLGLTLEDCAGTVVVDGCEAFGALGGAFNPQRAGTRIEGCDSVFVVDHASSGSNALVSVFTTGGPGLVSIGSTIAAFGGDLRGGDGASQGASPFFPAPGGVGGPGLTSFDSSLFLSATRLQGGSGGKGSDGLDSGGFQSPCGEGGAGGSGLVNEQTQTVSRFAELLGGPGGSGGTPLPGFASCSAGPDGSDLVDNGGSGFSPLPNQPRDFSVSPNPVRSGQTATIRFEGESGDVVFWALSVQSTQAPAPVLGGPVLIGANPFVITPGIVPPTGELITSVPVGGFAPGVEAIVLYEQALFVDTLGSFVIGPGRSVLHLAGGF